LGGGALVLTVCTSRVAGLGLMRLA
jgi:hypothetical protein